MMDKVEFLILRNLLYNEEYIRKVIPFIRSEYFEDHNQKVIFEEIGKFINVAKERSVDVMITRLRQKIEVDPKNPKYFQTIRGSGYVLWIE